MIQIFRLSLTVLILICLQPLAAVGQSIEPPPEPTNLSKKERSALIAIYQQLVEDTTPVKVGDTEDEMLSRLGQPDGTMTIGDRKRFSYADGSIITSGGEIIQIQDVPEALLATPNREAFEDYMAAIGNVYYMGKWMPKAEAREAYDKAIQDRQLTQQRITTGKTAKAHREQQIAIAKTSYYNFRRKGSTIQLSELLAPGRVTIVDFYADWCAPCKAIDPYLRGLANDPDVAVRKVDIVNWGTPVARQWGLKSIPNMRVYDRNGKPVGDPTHDIREIYKYIRRAKRG